MTVDKVRKRAVEMLSILWTGDNADEIVKWTSGGFRLVSDDGGYSAEVHDDLHGTWIKMRIGDRVMRGVQGEHYPIRPDTFAATYERVEEV